MITLRELLKLNETVTLLELYVREPNGNLIRRSVIGQPYQPSIHQRYDEERGRFEWLDVDINKHNRPNKVGQSEIAFGMDWKAIPKKYLDAEVTDIHWLRERYGSNEHGSVLDATIVPIQMRLDLEAD